MTANIDMGQVVASSLIQQDIGQREFGGRVVDAGFAFEDNESQVRLYA